MPFSGLGEFPDPVVLSKSSEGAAADVRKVSEKQSSNWAEGAGKEFFVSVIVAFSLWNYFILHWIIGIERVSDGSPRQIRENGWRDE